MFNMLSRMVATVVSLSKELYIFLQSISCIDGSLAIAGMQFAGLASIFVDAASCSG